MRINRKIASLMFIFIIPFIMVSCSTKPEQKTIVKSTATGNTKWQELWEGVGQPVTKICHLEEWQSEWSDGSKEYKWKSLGCRAMTDFEKARYEFKLQQAPTVNNPSSPYLSPYPSNTSRSESKNDKILKTIECVSAAFGTESVEVHYESGRIEVINYGIQVDLQSGLAPRWCAAERP